jgi:hypothetical protein
VSVLGGNSCYSCGTVEGVETSDIIEISNIDAVFVHVAEKMVGYGKWLGEYPTLSATISHAWSGEILYSAFRRHSLHPGAEGVY